MRTKWITWVAVIGLVFILFGAAGCGGGKTPGEKENKAPSADKTTASTGQGGLAPIKVTLVGGAVGGNWSAVGEGIGEAIRRVAPNSAFGYQPGQDGANAVTVGTGKAELGFLFPPTLRLALEGAPPFQQKISNLRAIGQFGAYTFGIFATESSGLKAIADIKKKPVVIGVGTKDGAMEICVREVLAAHGITYQDIEKAGGKVLYLSVGPTLDMMKNGKADAVGSVFGLPEAKVTEAAVTTKMVLLKPDPEALKKVADKLGLMMSKVPKDTYTFQKEDVPAFDMYTVLVCREDLPEQAAYTVAKALIDQLSYLKTVHPSLANDKPETIVKTPIPLHPGAEKYYKEKGLL